MKGELYGNYILLFHYRNRHINRFNHIINMRYIKERIINETW